MKKGEIFGRTGIGRSPANCPMPGTIIDKKAPVPSMTPAPINSVFGFNKGLTIAFGTATTSLATLMVSSQIQG